MARLSDRNNGTKKNRPVVRAVVVVLVLAFIWGNSVLSVSRSTQESRWVLNLVTPLLEPFVGAGNVTDHLVRKLAHFVEFTALGIALFCLFVRACRRRGPRFGGASGSSSGGPASDVTGSARPGWKAALYALQGSFFAAFLDETIQHFTGRGDRITDVWLDLAGAASGILFAWLLRLVFRRRK